MSVISCKVWKSKRILFLQKSKFSFLSLFFFCQKRSLSSKIVSEQKQTLSAKYFKNTIQWS